MKIICLFSGGMDSTTLLYKLISQGHEVVALSFNYGQKHSIELEYAKNIVKSLGILHKVFDISFLKDIQSDSLLVGGSGSPIVPCRNTLMITSAWALAECIGAEAVAVGAHIGDDEVFPDCRDVFFESLEQTLQLGSEKNIKILHPFTEINKSDIVRIGKKLGVDFSKTYTCYNGGEKPCGVCMSCIGRDSALSNK